MELDGDVIELSSAKPEDHERLVALLVQRHSSGAR
jgi:hypothetical protein